MRAGGGDGGVLPPGGAAGGGRGAAEAELWRCGRLAPAEPPRPAGRRGLNGEAPRNGQASPPPAAAPTPPAHCLAVPPPRTHVHCVTPLLCLSVRFNCLFAKRRAPPPARRACARAPEVSQGAHRSAAPRPGASRRRPRRCGCGALCADGRRPTGPATGGIRAMRAAIAAEAGDRRLTRYTARVASWPPSPVRNWHVESHERGSAYRCQLDRNAMTGGRVLLRTAAATVQTTPGLRLDLVRTNPAHCGSPAIWPALTSRQYGQSSWNGSRKAVADGASIVRSQSSSARADCPLFDAVQGSVAFTGLG